MNIKIIDINELKDIKKVDFQITGINKENDIKIKVGISILLESNFEFDKYYNELSSEERKEFEYFPIFNLKNNKTNDN